MSGAFLDPSTRIPPSRARSSASASSLPSRSWEAFITNIAGSDFRYTQGSMVRRKAETFEPVTMGHIRGHGCRDLLVYCNSGRSHHSATMNADWLSDETPVGSLCRRMVC